MIRRDVPLADEPTRWLLISQVEHARVSGELAGMWRAHHGEPTTGPSPLDAGDLPPAIQRVREELLAAITHHDDGWASWEASPPIDPETHRPYSFLDLPREQALPLWSDSILRAREFGPLAGWSVAGHFVRLLADSNAAEEPACRDWLAEMSTRRQSWLNEWVSLDRAAHSVRLAGECLEWVRTFDWLSLWLCCQCPATPDDDGAEPMTLSEGPLADAPVRMEAAMQQERGAPREVQVSPWPFAGPAVAIDALGYAVSVKQYQTSEQLARSRAPMRLRWRLMPGD